MLEDSPTGRCLVIEITPAMIAAGSNELAFRLNDLNYSEDCEIFEKVVEEIFRAEFVAR